MNHPIYKSIKGRFLIITLILVMIVGISASTFSYYLFSHDLRDNLIHSAETSLQFLTDDIDNSLDDIIFLTDWCQVSGDISSFVMTSKNKDSYNRITSNAADRLGEEFRTNSARSYICRLVIANKERNDYLQTMYTTTYSVDRPMASMIQELPYYNDLLYAHDYDFTVGIKEDPFMISSPKMLPLIRPIYHPYWNSVIGFVFVEVSFSLFTDAAQEYARRENTMVYFTIGEQCYEITPDEIRETDALSRLTEAFYDVRLSENTVVSQSAGDNSLLYVTVPLDSEGLSLTLPITNNLFHEQLHGYFHILFAILSGSIILGSILIYTLSRTVTRPINLLRRRILAIAEGDFSQDHTIEWDNELGDIGKNINQLSVDIHSLIDQKIAFEKQKKDYEYQVLQSQINPHFLYNTLNSIKWMASIQNAPGIAEMATALSHLLKNISKGTSTVVSIQDEITLLDDYFTIQKYRYGGTISLEYQIDEPVLLACQTLRFTLQPIVENAIFHGIEPKGLNGHILIHIYRSCADILKIDITDDGIGMDEATITSVLSGENAKRSNFFRQLGISSVHRQLKYTFGEEYGLTIKSEPGVYTTMTITLPITTETEPKSYD